jgi:hypothetical protein
MSATRMKPQATLTQPTYQDSARVPLIPAVLGVTARAVLRGHSGTLAQPSVVSPVASARCMSGLPIVHGRFWCMPWMTRGG